MATMYYESDLEFSGMFSMCSHQREKEKKKSDRKTGKERRKSEKSRCQSIPLDPLSLQVTQHSSTPTIWCETKKHFGTPILNEKGFLIIENCCLDCKYAEYKNAAVVKKVAEDILPVTDLQIIEEQTAYFDHYAQMEYDLDILEAQEAQLAMRLLKMEKTWAEEEQLDDYIPDIDDDYDF